MDVFKLNNFFDKYSVLRSVLKTRVEDPHRTTECHIYLSIDLSNQLNLHNLPANLSFN